MHTLAHDGGQLAYDLEGTGHLVVLAHGMGDSRHAYRFVVPQLVAAGYRVANVDLRGCGDSSTGWPAYGREEVAGDLIALIRHLGGPAVIVGHSLSGGAATVAAATAPDEVAGLIELAPFTRAQSVSVSGLLRNGRYRSGILRLSRIMLPGALAGWLSYLDLAIPAKPADWPAERARIASSLSDPDRMAVLRAMGKSPAASAEPYLAGVRSPVLVIEGGADPDWDDPAEEGRAIVDALPAGLGSLAVIDGAGHYPHAETPDEVVALVLPFLRSVFTTAGPRA